MLKKIILCTLILMLTNCGTQNKLPRYPEISFNSKQAYSLNVGQIDIVNNNIANKGNHVEDIFPLPPYQALNRWVGDRFIAKGAGDKSLKVIVKDASVIETHLPKTPGFKGAFTDDQTALYKAAIEVKFEYFEKDQQFPKAEMEIKVNRSKSISKNMTINDRNDLFYQLIKEIIHDFDDEFEKNYPSYFNSVTYQNG
jgi:hypothetical protein